MPVLHKASIRFLNDLQTQRNAIFFVIVNCLKVKPEVIGFPISLWNKRPTPRLHYLIELRTLQL